MPPSPPASPPQVPVVTIRSRRWDGALPAPITIDPASLQIDLKQEAMRWSYLVGNRAKWQSVDAETRNIDDKATQLTNALGIDEAQRRQLGQTRII
jgi:hypothetical protein